MKNSTKLFYAAITFGLCGIFLYYFIDFDTLGEVLMHVNWGWVIASLPIIAVNSVLGPIRLRILLRVIGAKLAYSYVWALANVGAFISVVLPFSAGGFAMPYFIARKAAVTYKKALAIVFVDAFFSLPLGIVTGLIAAAYFYGTGKIDLLSRPVEAEPLIVFVAFILVMIIAFIKLGYYKKIAPLVDNLARAIKLVKAQLAWPITITVVMAFTGTVQAYMYYLALGQQPPFVDFFLAGSLLGLLALIPSAIPMKIGQFETFAVVTLPYLLNIDKSIIFGILILQRLVSVGFIAVVGYISMLILKINISTFRR